MDIASLVALMHDFHAESGYMLDRSWAAESFRELLARPALGAVWLAHSGAEPIGHVVLTVCYAMEHGGLIGCIDDLYVKPGSRCIGVATALLAALFDECRDRACKAVHVEVGAGNAPARALYASFGLLSVQDDRVLLRGAIADRPVMPAPE